MTAAQQQGFRWCADCGEAGLIRWGEYPDGAPRYLCGECTVTELDRMAAASRRHPSGGRP